MSQLLFEILGRVRTYSIGKWSYTENPQLDPYRLASLGYMINSQNALECYVCHNQVVIKKSKDQADQNKILVSLNSHKQNCLYLNQKPTIFSRESLYLLMDDITTKLKESHVVQDQDKAYPILNIKAVQSYLKQQQFIVNAIHEGYKLDSKHFDIQFHMALFGWNYVKKQTEGLFECLFCGKSTKCSNLKTQETNIQDQEGSAVYLQQEMFNPVKGHRYFCIWINKSITSDDSQNKRQFVGWQIYLQFLYDKMIESKSLFVNRKPEETRKIRVQLDKYLENFQQQTSEKLNKVKGIFEECESSKAWIEKKLQQEGHLKDSQGEVFVDSRKRMKEFIDEMGSQFRETIKKIKL